jgi:twitching motility protein PilI
MSQLNVSFRKLLEYEQRSLEFQPGKGTGTRDSVDWAGVVFSVGDARLTCSINKVHEFLPPPPVTRVPGTKPWILGLANVRGDLVTVIDLSAYLGGETTRMTMRSRLLAATLRGRPVGLLVDEVFGQQNFDPEQASRAELDEDSPLQPYISNQYQDDGEVWQELDLDALFGTPEFLNGAAA